MTAAWVLAAIPVFTAGYLLAWHHRPAPVTAVEYREVPAGDFSDVPMVMQSSTGNAYRWSCDLHLTPDGQPDRAECEYRDP